MGLNKLHPQAHASKNADSSATQSHQAGLPLNFSFEMLPPCSLVLTSRQALHVVGPPPGVEKWGGVRHQHPVITNTNKTNKPKSQQDPSFLSLAEDGRGRHHADAEDLPDYCPRAMTFPKLFPRFLASTPIEASRKKTFQRRPLNTPPMVTRLEKSHGRPPGPAYAAAGPIRGFGRGFSPFCNDRKYF